MREMTATVADMAIFYNTASRPVGIVVSDDVILAQALKATRYYDGFGELENLARDEEVDSATEITKSEQAVIFPLFELYVERENALILESSRALGVEVYGRSVSEIASEITNKEQEIQNLAFAYDFITI